MKYIFEAEDREEAKVMMSTANMRSRILGFRVYLRDLKKQKRFTAEQLTMIEVVNQQFLDEFNFVLQNH